GRPDVIRQQHERIELPLRQGNLDGMSDCILGVRHVVREPRSSTVHRAGGSLYYVRAGMSVTARPYAVLILVRHEFQLFGELEDGQCQWAQFHGCLPTVGLSCSCLMPSVTPLARPTSSAATAVAATS